MLTVAVQTFGSAGAPLFGCSGVSTPAVAQEAPRTAAAGRSDPRRSSISSPEHLGARNPQVLTAAWHRWWRSRGRPRTTRRTFLLHGRRVAIIREALPPGWQYPCTDEELEAVLQELPAAWTARLRSVRWTYRPEWGAHARTDRARIEISYVVDEALRAPGMVMGHGPEEVQFGARVEEDMGGRSLVWADRDALRIYILRHILIHELGHHVAPTGMRVDDEEAWAEAFAFRYYTPPKPARLAESRP